MKGVKEVKTYAGLVAALAVTSALAQAPSPEWRLTRPLNDAEKANVLALASRLGIDRPAVIRNEVIHQPLGCQSLRIESAPVSAGHRRTWQRVWVWNTAGPDTCPLAMRDPLRIGNWTTAEPIREVGAWRVQDRGTPRLLR